MRCLHHSFPNTKWKNGLSEVSGEIAGPAAEVGHGADEVEGDGGVDGSGSGLDVEDIETLLAQSKKSDSDLLLTLFGSRWVAARSLDSFSSIASSLAAADFRADDSLGASDSVLGAVA